MFILWTLKHHGHEVNAAIPIAGSPPNMLAPRAIEFVQRVCPYAARAPRRNCGHPVANLMKKIPFGAWQHILLRPIRAQPSVRGETARHAVDGATSSALLHCPWHVYLEETLAVFALPHNYDGDT